VIFEFVNKYKADQYELVIEAADSADFPLWQTGCSIADWYEWHADFVRFVRLKRDCDEIRQHGASRMEGGYDWTLELERYESSLLLSKYKDIEVYYPPRLILDWVRQQEQCYGHSSYRYG